MLRPALMRDGAGKPAGGLLTHMSLGFSGVAEQFALAETAMNVWSMYEGPEQLSSSLDPLQGTDHSLTSSTSK